ncbi:transmembrane protein, putative (macronuclear) [Tetrahymena thermophila SB210]|uniref:Transmembrane protein, putative n=1 Tax=Tetrahymena thermophila (strain SB210) TaxID=312017 RepID=Q22TU8_TETTS|nr:transmembrane protein, putative [Tetrahymena thermophila SB210]EAR88663.2 transmembrane protein, putative [Tetrahymena thermophila SB210]|eukprot:XP_001008908.2 transmembrane protein, putative [Tetrahymena thermophila SB210]
MKQNQLKNLTQGLKLFYINDLYEVVKHSKRNIHFSLFCFFIQQLIEIQIQIDDATYSKLSTNDKILSKWVSYFFFLKELEYSNDSQNYLKCFIYAFLALNYCILIYLFIYAILRSRIKKASFLQFSQLFQCYEYLIAIPSLYFSIATYQYYLSLINLFTTLFLASLFISVDYDYTFQNEDVLQKSDSVLNLLSFYLDLILCITSCFFDIYSITTVSFIINIMKLIIILRTHAYFNKNICRWQIILTFFRLNLSLSMIVYSQNQQNLDLIFFLAIIMFPFCYKLGNVVVLEWYTFINLDYTDQKNESIYYQVFQCLLGQSSKKKDLFCRQLMDSTRQKVKLSTDFKNPLIIFAQELPFQGTAQNQEKTTQVEQMKVIKQKDLDKQEAQLDEQFKQDDASYFKSIKAILQIYQEAIRDKQDKQVLDEIDFSYLTFLASVNRNQCAAYLSILNTKTNRKLASGIKDQQKLQNIMKMTEIECLSYNIRCKNKKEDFQLYKILQFEEDLKNIQLFYCECLNLYRIIIEKLLLNFIEINEMLVLLKKFTEKRSMLERNIIQQLKYNHSSKNLRNICINFDYYMLHKSNLLKYYERLNSQSNQKQKNKEYYDESSCFLFVSLLDKSLGIIKKVNNSFIKTLGISDKQQIQEKSIFELQILPQRNYQQEYIQQNSFLEEVIPPIYNDIQNLPLFLAKHQAGYCVPFQLKVQTQVLDYDDFGLAIWAKPIKGQSIYLLLDDENPNNIKLANKLFYKQFKTIDTSQLKTIKIDSLIPIIHYLIQLSKNQKNTIKFQTVLIQPNQDFLLGKSIFSDANFLNYLKYADIFSITVSFYFLKKFSSFESSIYLIIEDIQPQNNLKDKSNLLQFYQQQIKEICKVDLNLDLDLEIQDNLTSMCVNQQENDESIQYRSSIQFVKNFSIQNEQSTLTQILNSATTNQNSMYKSNGQALKNNNSELKKVKKNNVTTFTSNSPRQNYEYMLASPVASQLQQINLQLEESTELNSKLFQNFAQISQNQEFYAFRKIQTQKSPEKQSILNQNDKFNFSQFEEVNLEYVQTSRHAVQEDLNSQIQKQITDIPPLSSKRVLIQTVASPQNKLKKKSQMQKINEKKVKDQKYSNQSFQEQEASKLQQQNIDIQSISSSSKSVQTRHVFENIHKKSQMRYLKIINAFGILSVLAILSLTLLAFFNFLTSLVSQRENFKYINWIYMINVQISYSLSERNIILLNKYNVLSTPAAQYQPFMDLLNEQNQSRISLSKQHMNLLYNNTNKDIEVFNIIQNNYIIQNIFQSNTISQQQNLSMIYSILLQIFGIFYFVSNKDPLGIIKKQNEMNYPALNEQVQSVFSQMNDDYQNQLSSIKNQSLIQLYVITFIMLLFLISVIPSYIFSKKKQQQILELFATFDKLQLKNILDQIANQLQFYQIDQKKNFIKYENKISNGQFKNHLAKSEKKLNISQTSSLNYSLKNLIVALILIFCLTTIYPIINYFIVKQFIDNSMVIYNFNNVVCVSYFAVLNSLRARQGLAMAFLIPQYQALSIQTYQGILNQLSVQIDELPNLLKENLEKIGSTSLHNQEIFDNFLINVFTDNACDTIKKYTQYQNGDFLYDQCNTVGKSSLKSGLLNGIIFFFSIFKDYYSFAFSPNATVFQKYFNNYNKNILAIKQFQFKIELSKEFEYLLNFFQEQNLQLYNFYENLSIVLVIIQVCLVVIIFIVSWSYYFKSINNQIYSTKQLLNIFPQQYLIQNTYVMSYLNLRD